jgi:anti-sigma B factor antagonist
MERTATGIMRGHHGLRVEVQQLPASHAALIVAEGEIDHRTFEVLSNAVRDLLDGGCVRLIIDLDRVAFVSSSGLGVFVSTVAETRSGGGDLVLVRPQQTVREVFATAGLTDCLPVVENLDAAVAVFSGEPGGNAQP